MKTLCETGFQVKYLNGSVEACAASVREISKTVTELELKADLDYKNVDCVELVLHSEPIKSGDAGYYVVPAFCAGKAREYALCHFREREDEEFVFDRYYMPVVGIKHLDKCYIGILTGMRYELQQVVQIKDNIYTIKLRCPLKGKLPYDSIRLEIHDLGAEACWTDMAREYRGYQLSHGFQSLKERLNPELKYSLQAPNVRIHMGWKPVPCEIYEQTPENEPEVHVACTFQDVINLMEGYKAAGIQKAEFCLVGWNVSGHDGRWPQILPVESKFGGEAGLKKLIERAKELGYAMTCHTNSTDCYSIAENFDINDIAVEENGELSSPGAHWGGGRTYNCCPKRAYEISMETLPAVAELGFRGMHYIDVITASCVRDCHSEAHPVNKEESVAYFDNLFAEAKKMFGSIGSEGPLDAYMRNVDYTLYVSFADYRDTENCHELSDMRIPFWQMVYHGIVASNPYSRTINTAISDEPHDLLKVIEYGGKPQIYYYAQFVTDNSDWLGRGDFYCNTPKQITDSAQMVKKTMDIYDEMSYLQYEFMENHEQIEPNVFKITYSDGSVILVDYNKNTYSLCKAENT